MAKNKHIIDGVDVSECKLYRDEISFVGGEIYTDVCSIWIWQRDYSGLEPSCVMKCHCSDNPNCLFKQLARKTQECERLKNERTVDLVKQLDQLKAENEEYKKNKELYEQRLKTIKKVNNQFLYERNYAERKLKRITNILFTGQCSNCEGYSPNCSNKELCDFKHNIKNIIDEVQNAKN